MKNQYRLKKWYPSLHSLQEGDLVKRMETQNLYSHENGTIVYPAEVENNPEFWEKVEEKDYEILTYKGKITGKIYPTKTGSMIYDNEKDIHSVKRLSDGEVFTVGDKICGTRSGLERSQKYVTIDSFELYNGRLKINIDTGFISNDLPTFPRMEHYKERLFTTHDGVDIYGGDTYWKVFKDYTLCGPYSADTTSSGKDTAKYFSNKREGFKWIDENKPQYSKEDIRRAFIALYGRCTVRHPFGKHNYESLIKEIRTE